MKKKIIRPGLVLACAVLATAVYTTASDQPAQSPSEKWQVATIMDVKVHSPAPGEDANVYDVTVRVGNTEYVVLYAPPDGSFKEAVKYKVGIDSLVLVGTDTIKYNDMLGKTYEVPIVSRRTAAKSPRTSERPNIKQVESTTDIEKPVACHRSLVEIRSSPFTSSVVTVLDS